MLMQELCPASEPHVPTTKHLMMDPVIWCAENRLELASVAASLSQFVNFSTHKVVCVLPLDSVALSAAVSVTQYNKTLVILKFGTLFRKKAHMFSEAASPSSGGMVKGEIIS